MFNKIAAKNSRPHLMQSLNQLKLLQMNSIADCCRSFANIENRKATTYPAAGNFPPKGDSGLVDQINQRLSLGTICGDRILWVKVDSIEEPALDTPDLLGNEELTVGQVRQLIVRDIWHHQTAEKTI